MRSLPRWLIAATCSFLRDGGQRPLEKMMQDTGVVFDISDDHF